MRDNSGYSLWSRWARVVALGCCPEWKEYEAFEKWAMETGWEYGMVLKRLDVNSPCSPENCCWVKRKIGDEQTWEEEWIEKWNKSVNRIRSHYGMEPLATK